MDTLTVRNDHGAPWSDTSIVHDDRIRADVGEWLSRPLKRGDKVHRFDGLPELVVSLRETISTHGPLVLIDPSDGSVVARPTFAPDLFGSFDIGSFLHVPQVNLMLASNGSGSTLEAISTDSWEVVWRDGWTSHSGRRRRVSLRGERVYSWATHSEHVDVHEVATGATLFEGVALHLSVIDGDDTGRWVAATSAGTLYLLDGDDFEHVMELWLKDRDGGPPRVAAIGADGTFDVPLARLRDAQVLLVGGSFVPALELAPWLWDPLHVRSLRDDEDRAARRVPARN